MLWVFQAAIFLYVTVESAVYVWMPTLLASYHGRLIWVATYAISIFFVLRAAGRFIGSWVLARLNWATVVTSIQPRHTCFALGYPCLAGVGIAILPSAVVGPVHVGALSHTQLERHQLFSQAGTWRSVRSDSVFHMCGGCVGTTGHGCG